MQAVWRVTAKNEQYMGHLSFSFSKEEVLLQKHLQDNDLCAYLTLKLGKQGRDLVAYSCPLKAIPKELLRP